MAKQRVEPLLWLLFTAGGMAAALMVPVMLLLFGLAIPLDWVSTPDRDHLITVAGNPLTRIVLLGFCVLALAHWAHRFRYTLYEGLQLKHLGPLIGVICYAVVITGSVLAAYLLLVAL